MSTHCQPTTSHTVLSDEEQRKLYDASGYNEDYAQNGGAGAGGFHFTGEGMDFSDLFSSFFGGGGGSGGSPGGSRGSNGFAFNFGGPSGGGGSPFGGFESFGGPDMGSGHGRGSKGRPQNMYGGHHQHQPSQQRPKQAKPQKVFVDLEALMDDSFHAVTPQKGRGSVELEVPKGCPEGHVIEEQGHRFAIHTKPNQDFVRGTRSHKSDLYTNVSITLEQALLGFTLEVLTIDGELIEEEMESVPHSMEYQVKRKGLPRFDATATTRGHLFVRFDVQYPTLSESEKEEMEKRREKQGSWDYSEAQKYREKQEKKRLRREKRRNRNKSEL